MEILPPPFFCKIKKALVDGVVVSEELALQMRLLKNYVDN